jgi:DNA polymerase-1
MNTLTGNRRKIVWDIETDGLDAKKIHILVAKVCGEDGYYIFREADTFRAFYEDNDDAEWIGHNSIAFDSVVLSNLWGITIPVSRQSDTLVMSRLWEPTLDKHSLEAWGNRLGEKKIEFKEFTEYTEEMKVYCKQDVKITERLYTTLSKNLKGFSEESIRLEHTTQYIISQQIRNGFLLDKNVAMEIYAGALQEANRIEEAVVKYFPPIVTERYSEKTGKRLKDSIEKFNLASPSQIVSRLNELGWKPVVPTKTGKSWKICQENLATIPDVMPNGEPMPQCIKDLKKWKILETRWKTAKDWLDRMDGDGRVHGQVIVPGTVTHRASHQNPNMANIPSISSERGLSGLYAYECRQAWTVPGGSALVGTDAAGIQLRVLAHYMNDPEYTKTLLEGDIHTFNKNALGEFCKDRPTAKTFIYAWLLGAGQAKVAQILGCTVRQAGDAMDNFLRSIPALKELKRKAGMAAQRGYLVSLDGRRIKIESEHKSLSVYLQGGETVIMRMANYLWYTTAKKEKINFKQVVWVHDEWQTEVEESRAEDLGRLQVQSIRDTGEYYNLNCPLDGEFKVGKNWAETH